MSGYPTDDEPAPIRYMSVPEEIQFTTSVSPTSGTSYHGHSYMRVPDTITLDDPHPFVGSVVHDEEPPSQERRQEQTDTIEREPHASQDKIAHDDLEQRVQVLEEKVQRLSEARGSGEVFFLGPRQGNGFWTVLSFASWIMVPLVFMFMYQYKKTA